MSEDISQGEQKRVVLVDTVTKAINGLKISEKTKSDVLNLLEEFFPNQEEVELNLLFRFLNEKRNVIIALEGGQGAYLEIAVVFQKIVPETR